MSPSSKLWAMKRHLLEFVLFIAMIATLLIVAVTAASPPPLPHVVSTSHPGAFGSASATPLWGSWYMTCKHCLPVATIGGLQVIETIKHPTLDLALLRVDGPVGTGSVLADDLPVLGDRLVAMGYGLGKSLQMTDGRATSVLGGMTCSIIYGCSGGAVLNDRGELVGIISQISSISNGFLSVPVPHMSHYIPIPKIWLRNQTGV